MISIAINTRLARDGKMPALAELLAKRAGVALEVVHEAAELVEREILEHVPILNKRISIPC